MSPIVAHTIGSFWYCLDCVEELGQDDELEPCHSSELIEGTPYYCDSCGSRIDSEGS